MKKKIVRFIIILGGIGLFGALGLVGLRTTFAEEILKPPIFISAINPGYTVDGKSNVGEFIELYNMSGETVSLSGISLAYVNSSGNVATLFEFAEGSSFSGETLLLRYSGSPEVEDADANYTKTLAFSAGPLELLWNGEVLSDVCWTGKEGCLKAFKSASPTVLVWNFETEEYEHIEVGEYAPKYDKEKPGYLAPDEDKKEEEKKIEPHCRGLEFSEILSYYEIDKSEQFVEIHNPTDKTIELSGCSIGYKKKNYGLVGKIEPDEYLARYATDFTLTKNPTSSNELILVDEDGSEVDKLVYANGQKRAVAFAQFEYDNSGKEQWLQTYHATPDEPNDYQQYKTCAAGKVINEATGNCVSAVSVTQSLAECPAGKVRNPLTNRCVKVSSTAPKEPTPCAEGYERNPLTNRCRKIVKNEGADYAVKTEEFEEDSGFVAIWVIVGALGIGVIYVIFQFRREIGRFLRKILRMGPKKLKAPKHGKVVRNRKK